MMLQEIAYMELNKKQFYLMIKTWWKASFPVIFVLFNNKIVIRKKIV